MLFYALFGCDGCQQSLNLRLSSKLTQIANSSSNITQTTHSARQLHVSSRRARADLGRIDNWGRVLNRQETRHKSNVPQKLVGWELETNGLAEHLREILRVRGFPMLWLLLARPPIEISKLIDSSGFEILRRPGRLR